MTFSEAFYGTYKIDKWDGKPHLKEGLLHPFQDLFRIVFIGAGITGVVIIPLILSIQFQFFRSVHRNPAQYDPLTFENYILVSGIVIAFCLSFLILVISRVFFCKGNMHAAFASSLLVLSITQIVSHYAQINSIPSFPLQTILNIFMLILSGSLLIFLSASGICMYAMGLTALINVGVAKFRIYKNSKS